MLRTFFIIMAASIATNGPCERAHAANAVPRINCDAAHQRDLELTPVGAGPLTLSAIYCQMIRFTPFPKSDPLISPDAQSIAYYEHGTTLRVARLDDHNGWTDYQAEMTFQRFSSSIRSLPAFSWASTSKFLWTSTQEKLRPSGFAKTPLRAATTAADGNLQMLPPLRHDAGPLDTLLWAGGEGLAVAQFGMRGEYYRPAHSGLTPSFAIVDAQQGRVLDTLPLAAIESLGNHVRGASPTALVRNAAATTMQDGRVRALLSVGQWVVWTQGQAPRVVADPYIAEFNNRMTIAPDGSRVLVGRLLRTEGGFCEFARGCTAGKPVEGVLAALHDLGTGQVLWSIPATVTGNYEFPTPAISQDGRYALVGLVPADSRPLIALISMEDGRVVQTVPASGDKYAMGFAHGGLTVWTHAYGLTALYEVRSGAN